MPRFMILLKGGPNSESGAMPDPELLTAMGQYNEELATAGVITGGDGLHPSSKGAKVAFANGQVTVVDGPFAEAKELLAGYWIFKCADLAEAVAWIKKCPDPQTRGDGTWEMEIRQLFDTEDFDQEHPAVQREYELREIVAENAKKA